MSSEDQEEGAKLPTSALEVPPAADLPSADQDDGELIGQASFPASDPPAVWTWECGNAQVT